MSLVAASTSHCFANSARANGSKLTKNVILLGPTGIGKSYLASALAEAACRRGLRALFIRVPRLTELAVARASGTYGATLSRFPKIDVLVLDDFLLAPMKDSERRDLLEVLEDRLTEATRSSHPSSQQKLGTRPSVIRQSRTPSATDW